MELFSIECTTCQQRLKVRDESAIGEIQICSKCGSMVLVETPPDWQGTLPAKPPPTQSIQPPPVVEAGDKPDEAPPATSEMATPPPQRPEAFPITVRSDETLPVSQEPGSAEDARRFDAESVGTQPMAEQDPEPVPADEPPVAAVGEVMPPDARPASPAEPVLPTDDWTSQAAQQRRQWLLVGGTAIAGIVLAIGLVGLLASRDSRSGSTEPVADGELDIESPQDTDDSTANDVSEDDETESEAPKGPGGENDGGEDTDKPSEPPADEGAWSKLGTEPPEAPEALPPEPKANPDQKMPSKSDGKGKLILKPADDEPDATVMDTAALAKTLELLAPFADSQPYTPPQSGEASATAPKLDPAALPAEGPSAPRPEPRKVNVAERLKDEIPEIEFPNVPLIDFLRFVTDFSTIPITLDPDALALVDITPQEPVNVKLANTNVANLLTVALASVDLGYGPLDGQLLATRPPPPNGQLRSHAHSVADLVGNDPAQLARLAGMIVEMVEPDSWKVNGGVGIVRQNMPSLEFQHRDVEKFRAIVFCEKLRVARGLPPQSTFNQELFKLEPRLSQAKPQLATPVTINYIQPTLFVRILERLGKETGLQILVDWQAVAELGWSPEGEATISANNEPIGQTLAKMLLPMDLTYRVVNATTVQITSPTALVARLDVEFYPIDNALLPQETPEAFLQRIRQGLGEEGLRDIGATVHLDIPSRHLIAALPQPWQQELADLLNHGKGKPKLDPPDAPSP